MGATSFYYSIFKSVDSSAVTAPFAKSCKTCLMAASSEEFQPQLIYTISTDGEDRTE